MTRLFLVKDRVTGKIIEAFKVPALRNIWKDYEEVEKRIVQNNEDIEASYQDADFYMLRDLALAGALK